jgi:hypothetical protein
MFERIIAPASSGRSSQGTRYSRGYFFVRDTNGLPKEAVVLFIAALEPTGGIRYWFGQVLEWFQRCFW